MFILRLHFECSQGQRISNFNTKTVPKFGAMEREAFLPHATFNYDYLRYLSVWFSEGPTHKNVTIKTG